ncbi:MAG: NAD-dependent epimerase/dehydratase family protein [Nitrospinae bacterium]|nr:NAD-dependent epimerase/dehydratase family protein [Nitrospinota bacterium]
MDLEVNTLAVLHLLEVCRLKKYFPRIVFASSSNLVGLPDKLPVNESCQDNPSTIFAINKLFSEKYLKYYAREFGQHSIVLRLANVYGPVLDIQASIKVVLNRIICRALKGEKLFLYRNSACIRDYVWIEDVVAAFHAAVCLGNEHATGQHYLIGSGNGYQISDVMTMVVDKVTQQTGKKIVIEKDTNEILEAIEWRNFVADTSSFKKVAGWESRVSLDEGIDRTINYFLNSQMAL